MAEYVWLEIDQKVSFLCEEFCCAGKLHIWCYDAQGNLEYTVPAEDDLLQSLFSVGNCKPYAWQEAQNGNMPILLNDVTGLVWMAVPYIADGCLQRMYVLGPAFTVEITRPILEQEMAHVNVSLSIKDILMEQLLQLPVVSFSMFQLYGQMLYRCLYGVYIHPADIRMQTAVDDHSTLQAWQEENAQSTWMSEQTMFQMMKEGLLDHKTVQQSGLNMLGIKRGRLAEDPLRHAKDEIIVSIALYTRAAMSGGVLPEIAYTVSDFYIQEIEKCRKINDVYVCAGKMMDEFSRRVQKARENSRYSVAVRGCIDYIDMHIREDISLKQISEHLGYTPYYLTEKFRKETGISLREHIKKRKVEYACILLQSQSEDIAHVGEELAFSTPSYFSQVFKKYTGLTPTEYRERKHPKTL